MCEMRVLCARIPCIARSVRTSEPALCGGAAGQPAIWGMSCTVCACAGRQAGRPTDGQAGVQEDRPGTAWHLIATHILCFLFHGSRVLQLRLGPLCAVRLPAGLGFRSMRLQLVAAILVGLQPYIHSRHQLRVGKLHRALCCLITSGASGKFEH